MIRMVGRIIYFIGGLLVTGMVSAQQLETYIQEAEDNNPEIQAFEARFGSAINSLKAMFETLGNRDEYRYDNIRGIQG